METPGILINNIWVWLDEIEPYKAVDSMGKWWLSFSNNDTRINAKIQLQKFYREQGFEALVALIEKNEGNEINENKKTGKVTKKAV